MQLSFRNSGKSTNTIPGCLCCNPKPMLPASSSFIHSIKESSAYRRNLQANVIVWSKPPINVPPKSLSIPLMRVSFPYMASWPFDTKWTAYIDGALSQAQMWVLQGIGKTRRMLCFGAFWVIPISHSALFHVPSSHGLIKDHYHSALFYVFLPCRSTCMREAYIIKKTHIFYILKTT